MGTRLLPVLLFCLCCQALGNSAEPNEQTWELGFGLGALGGPDWFRLGDRDLATHIIRSARLRDGESLTTITADLSQRLGMDLFVSQPEE